MTAHTDIACAHLDAQVEAVSAARALVRSKLPHKASDIRRAALTLKLLGDGLDWIEGREVLRALDMPKAAKVETPPPYSPQPRMIRTLLVDSIFAAVAAVVIVVMLGGPM